MLLFRYDSILIHPPIRTRLHTLLAHQVHNGNEVVPAAEEHQCIGTGDRHQEADIDDEKKGRIGPLVWDRF